MTDIPIYIYIRFLKGEFKQMCGTKPLCPFETIERYYNFIGKNGRVGWFIAKYKTF